MISMIGRQASPIHSSVDPLLVCERSISKAFHFRDCRSYFCLPLTLSSSSFASFLFPGTFHLKWWRLAFTTLTGLVQFSLGFQFYQTRPDQNCRCPPPMRTALPVLWSFFFEGANEYLEDLVAWIDAPQLDVCSIDLHGQTIYDIPHFSQFISCSKVLEAAIKVRVNQYCRVSVKLPLPTRMSGDGRLRLDF